MQKAILLLVATICCEFLFAQQRLVSYDYLFKRNDSYPATSIFSEANNGFLLSLTGQKSIKRILVNSNGRSIDLIEQFFPGEDSASSFKYKSALPGRIENLYKKGSFVGGHYDNGDIFEIIRRKTNFDFYFIDTELSSGNTLMNDTVKSNSNEKIIACLNKNNKLYLLTYITGTNKLTIYEKQKRQPLKTVELNVSFESFGKITNRATTQIREFSDIFRRNNFAVYENNMRYPVMFTAIRNKAYIQKDKIIFSVTSNKLNTYLITVSLDSFNYTIKTFDQDETKPDNEGIATTASCLVDSFLITCHAKDDKLRLNIFNAFSGNIIKTFVIDKNNIADIVASPVQKTGSFLSKSDILDADFRKFYKTARTNEISMTGYSENGKLFLSFAAPYKQIINGNTVLDIALSAAGSYFINTAPNTYGYFLSGNPGVKVPTNIGFDACIDLQSVNFTKGLPDFSVWDKIRGFIESHNLNIKYCLFFYMNSQYYLGYIFIPENRYYVYRFNEKGLDK